MKVDGTSPIHRVIGARPVASEPSNAAGAAAARQGDTVKLSGTAQWLQSLQSAATQTPEVRPDVVQEARADVASGAIDQGVTLEAALDALMSEL